MRAVPGSSACLSVCLVPGRMRPPKPAAPALGGKGNRPATAQRLINYSVESGDPSTPRTGRS